MSEPDGAPEDPEEEHDPIHVLIAGVVIYGLIGSGALLWLWICDRTDALVEQAIGERGVALGAAVGLATGVAGAWLVERAIRRSDGFRDVATKARGVFARAGDNVVLTFALLSAIAEELLFRLAIQDTFGLFGSVAAYLLLNTSIWRASWFVFTLVHAVTLGLIVHLGFGLLASTTAHAIFNYLSLRNLQIR